MAYAVTDNNFLISFDTENPGVVTSAALIQGLENGENIQALDFRPATGELYGLGRFGTQARLYKINTGTGRATAVGEAPFSTSLTGSRVGFDFNPLVDRIRVTTDTEQNMRVNPDTGALAAIDSPLTPSGNLAEIAYTRNRPGDTTTAVFGLDSNSNALVVINPPNVGLVVNVGAVGLDFDNAVGFDIVGDDEAYATLSSGPSIALYRIDLSEGAATKVGDIANNTVNIIGMSIAFEQFAPTIDTGLGNLDHPDVTEDATGGDGIAVADLLAQKPALVSDQNPGALRGIAVVGATDVNGKWQYSTDGGDTWADFGIVFDGAARLLSDAAGNRVRYLPRANFAGADADSISFRAWDRTSGADGGRVDVSTNGGFTAYSAQTARVFVDVANTNDAPAISGISPERTIRNDRTIKPFPGVVISDLDAGQTLVVEVRLDKAVKGSFVGTSLAASGFTKVNNRLYRFLGTDAQASSAIRKLRFDPADNRKPIGQVERTRFRITVKDGAATVFNKNTTIVALQV